MDLSKYNTQQLNQLKKDIDKELKARRKDDVKKAQRELKEVADKYGIALSDLVSGAGGRPGKKPAGKIRFRHPDDSSRGWSGRGRKPQWVKDWESKGKSLEELRVS